MDRGGRPGMILEGRTLININEFSGFTSLSFNSPHEKQITLALNVFTFSLALGVSTLMFLGALADVLTARLLFKLPAFTLRVHLHSLTLQGFCLACFFFARFRIQ